MKIILTLLICAIGLIAFGQTKYTAVGDNNMGTFKSDTLVIADTSIHFIKIGNQVFGIKRNIELVPVVEHLSITFPKWSAVTLDSMIIHTPYNDISPAINK